LDADTTAMLRRLRAGVSDALVLDKSIVEYLAGAASAAWAALLALVLYSIGRGWFWAESGCSSSCASGFSAALC
jgi:hypothetical protein